MNKTIGILLFPDAEELDFVGPYEVLAGLKWFDKQWRVVTVAQSTEPLSAANGLRVVPDYDFGSCPPLGVLLVPGGLGTRTEVDNSALIEFVRRVGADCEWTTSVCTGALVLERAGFLKGRRATTHWAALSQLREMPDVTVEEERFVVDGNVVTAAGVSAGIDMALYLAGRLIGDEHARNIQKLIEYYPKPPFDLPAAVGAGKEQA
jgi:transcriptional regulator GlxA family with amidase domain